MSASPHARSRPVVGVLPAAGFGRRLARTEGSKELVALGLDARGRERPVSARLIESMREAGAHRLFFVLRPGKWDIPAHFADGADMGIDIAYLVVTEPYGPPFTAARALAFAGDATILFGFPDIVIDPSDAMARLLRAHRRSGADLSLALFPAPRHIGADVVEFARDGRVISLRPKEDSPGRTDHDFTYLLAAWEPTFGDFLRNETDRLRRLARDGAFGEDPEWPMGAPIAAAIEAGLDVRGLPFPDGRYIDVGTPERLEQARRGWPAGAAEDRLAGTGSKTDRSKPST